MKSLTCILIFLSLMMVTVASRAAGEPDFGEVLQAFYQTQGLQESDLLKLGKRLRLSAALPSLSMGYDHQLRSTESLSITDNISVSGGRVTVGPEDNNLDIWNNLGRVFHVRAMWQLNELMFHRGELDVLRFRRDLVRLRQLYAQQIYRAYEERQLCRERVRQNSAGKRAMMYRVRYRMLTEQLDALTGRIFHHQFMRSL